MRARMGTSSEDASRDGWWEQLDVQRLRQSAYVGGSCATGVSKYLCKPVPVVYDFSLIVLLLVLHYFVTTFSNCDLNSHLKSIST